MNSPTRIASPSGISAEFNANGSLRRLDHGDIMINLHPGNEMDGGLTNIHLRRLDAAMESIPLLGPGSPASYQAGERGLLARGRWGDIEFRLHFVLAESAPVWFWHVELENTGAAPATLDLIHTQDVGLAHYGAIRLNEFYVSQYVDHTPLPHATHGCTVASRQNQNMGGRCPWTVIGSLGRATAFATDALQFSGLEVRAGGEPSALRAGLPNRREQHEHSLVAVQDEPVTLAPGAKVQRGFFGSFTADRRTATSPGDVQAVDAALALPEAMPPASPGPATGPAPAVSHFSSAPLLEALPLDDSDVAGYFYGERRQPEYDGGELLSFFRSENSHVVLQAKELRVLRPHGHLLRSGGALIPDEAALTSTAWMSGVFHSMVTQGHVSINRFLSTCHTYLSLFRSHGQRVFVELEGRWHLLDVPSGFEMTPDQCRWIYKHSRGVIEAVSSARGDRHVLNLSLSVLQGAPARFLISHHVAINGDDGIGAIPVQREMRGSSVFVRPVPNCDVGWRFPDGGFLVTPSPETTVETIGGDELLFGDGVSRNQPFLCLRTAASRAVSVAIEGRLVESTGIEKAGLFWQDVAGGLCIEAPAGSSLTAAAGRMAEIFPWFVHNALVHYLCPRGLEQYSGGGWGTRDVCQGPVELLLALGRFAPVRDLLLRVFRQQNADGDWPQWFMFFDRERNIRPGDSHGDIVYWPLVALAQYVSATGDAALLEETVPFFHPDGGAAAERGTVWQHVERALKVIRGRVITGTHLAAYGHGDWNDSLQPVRPDMRERLCSSWTVTLNYQMLTALGEALHRVGKPERAAAMQAEAVTVLEEFQRVLIKDHVIAGFAYFHEDGKTGFLLHPDDSTTGLRYSALAMIHAIISDMLTPQQAESHLALIRQHLTGPDGVRLFDKPLAYHGGLQKYFQRAESASFFGREIGIMYMHAHLRYCEALARFGDAEAFFHALCQVVPIGTREIVPSAALRQANCYFSSSDAAFADRYEAFADYAKVSRGEVPLEGGWRVYSSGAGISVRLIRQCFLGLRFVSTGLVIDPVIPPALHGLKTRVKIEGGEVEITYRITGKGRGVVSAALNGKCLPFTREQNPYRTGGACFAWKVITDELTGTGDRLEVTLE